MTKRKKLPSKRRRIIINLSEWEGDFFPCDLSKYLKVKKYGDSISLELNLSEVETEFRKYLEEGITTVLKNSYFCIDTHGLYINDGGSMKDALLIPLDKLSLMFDEGKVEKQRKLFQAWLDQAYKDAIG